MVDRGPRAKTTRETLITALARAIEDAAREGDLAVVRAATLALAALAEGEPAGG